MGFAPPLHNGFAFLASAHRCARLATNTSYIGSQPHASPTQYSLEDRLRRGTMPPCGFVSLACPPYYQRAMKAE